jgi:hypothetical protein
MVKLGRSKGTAAWSSPDRVETTSGVGAKRAHDDVIVTCVGRRDGALRRPLQQETMRFVGGQHCRGAYLRFADLAWTSFVGPKYPRVPVGESSAELS